MEGFLDLKVPIWLRTLITRSIALIPAVAVALLTAQNPNLNNTVNQWLNILQSVQLPFALLPVLHFCSDTRVIGVNVYLVLDRVVGSPWWAWLLAAIFFIAYGGFISVIIRSDLKRMLGGARACLAGS